MFSTIFARSLERLINTSEGGNVAPVKAYLNRFVSLVNSINQRCEDLGAGRLEGTALRNIIVLSIFENARLDLALDILERILAAKDPVAIIQMLGQAGQLENTELQLAQVRQEAAALSVALRNMLRDTGRTATVAEAGQRRELIEKMASILNKHTISPLHGSVALCRILREAGIEAVLMEMAGRENNAHYWVESEGLIIDIQPFYNFRIPADVELELTTTKKLLVTAKDDRTYGQYYASGTVSDIDVLTHEGYSLVVEKIRNVQDAWDFDETIKRFGRPKESRPAESAERRKPLTKNNIGSYLSHKIGVYRSIIGSQSLVATNGDTVKRGGILGAMDSRNGFGAARKYVVIVGSEKIVPPTSSAGRSRRTGFEIATEEVTRLFRDEGYNKIDVRAVADITQLNEFLEKTRGATTNNTFIYYDTSIEGIEDNIKEGYMSANLTGVPDEGGYLPIGGLTALAVAAMAVAEGQYVEEANIHRLIAALIYDSPKLQDAYAERLAGEWRTNGWTGDGIRQAFYSGLLEIPVQPLNIREDLEEHYRREAREAEISRAL